MSRLRHLHPADGGRPAGRADGRVPADGATGVGRRPDSGLSRRVGAPGARAGRWTWRRRAGPAAGLDDLVATVTGVAAALRSGAPPAEAWRRAGVRAPLGVPSREELERRWPGQRAAVATLVAAADLTVTLGVAPATVLDQVAATLVRDAEAAAQRRTALAGPLATARLLAWLPAVGLLLGVALGADPLAVLLDAGAGSALLLAGTLLLLAGRRWTRRYVAEARRAADG